MINAFVMRRILALFMVAAFSVLSFFIVLIYFGMIWGLVSCIIFTALSMVIASKILQNPFTVMLEGNGIMTFVIDSTGLIRPFIMSLKRPFIEGSLSGNKNTDIFDRDAVYNLATPQKGGSLQQVVNEEGKMHINLELTEEEYNKGRFGMFHYPVLLYNDQIKSIVTKDFLATKEKELFAEHTILYLNRKMEELTSLMRDFGRYVVEQLKPKAGISVPNWLMWIIIIGGLGLVAYYFWPYIFPAAKTLGTNAVDATKNVVMKP